MVSSKCESETRVTTITKITIVSDSHLLETKFDSVNHYCDAMSLS